MATWIGRNATKTNNELLDLLWFTSAAVYCVSRVLIYFFWTVASADGLDMGQPNLISCVQVSACSPCFLDRNSSELRLWCAARGGSISFFSLLVNVASPALLLPCFLFFFCVVLRGIFLVFGRLYPFFFLSCHGPANIKATSPQFAKIDFHFTAFARRRRRRWRRRRRCRGGHHRR